MFRHSPHSTQGSLLAVLRILYMVPRIELGLTAYKASILPTVLSCQPLNILFLEIIFIRLNMSNSVCFRNIDFPDYENKNIIENSYRLLKRIKKTIIFLLLVHEFCVFFKIEVALVYSIICVSLVLFQSSWKICGLTTSTTKVPKFL